MIVGDVTCALAQEVAKNVVLAGVARVTLVPDGSVSSGFLGADLEGLGHALRAMNPLVDVTVATESHSAAADADVVCSVGCGVEKDRSLAIRCGELGVPLLCGRMAGFVGWFHLGLGDFSYTPEGKEEKSELFPRLHSALDAKWGGERKRSAFAWHMAAALLAFEQTHGRLPGLAEGEFDSFYAELAKSKGASLTAPDDLVRDLGRCAAYSLPAFAAIVGGVWGREVVKVLSRRDPPLNNLFMYNARTSVGAVEKVGE